jgi:tetratricopeptide (TPR) repeat protein
MSDHFFISYSPVDGIGFSPKLADELAAGLPAFRVWLDKRNLRPSEDWDEQIVEAIRTCKGMIFVMTKDSVNPLSSCKKEWVRALKYKKPIIPLLVSRDAEMPFSLEPREYINFTVSFDAALARLRKHLDWMDSSEGQLQALKHRLADAQRDLPRAEADQQARIQEDIAELERQIAQQQAIIANPQAAEQRVQQTIDQGLERVREPAKPISQTTHSTFINPPPLVAPTWFQDRHVETRLIGDFLKDEALRLMTVVGRGGIGKSAMVCRLLRSLEGGQLPDDGGPLAVDGIVYLSNARSIHRVNVPDIYAGLTSLLSEENQRRLDSVYKNPQVKTRETMQALLGAFPRGRTVVLLDNFEDAVDVETGRIKDAELDEAMRALLELPPHGLKVIITTRVPPRDLALVEPSRQRRRDMDTGLEHPFAEEVLRAMDADGKVGLRDAPQALLSQARERTRGYPRALEHLFGILSADRDTSLQEILDNTKRLLPEKVVAVLVGEAFNRLDPTAQRVMQALAIYRYPVPSAAVDYLLQPYVLGVDSGPVLRRLVNMQFVRRDAGRYYLHQIDRDYADSRIPDVEPADRRAEVAPFSRFALQHRAAEWFKLARKPRETWKTLEDLAAPLSEFELRCASADYDTAATVLLEIGFHYLFMWGHYRLVTELHERLQGNIADPGLQQKTIGNQGSAYSRIGQYQRALACYERALSLAQEHKDRWGEGLWLNNLGLCYADLGQMARAIEYFEQALAINREVGNRRGEGSTLNNLGLPYANLGQTARAIEYFVQALAITRELESRDVEALTLSNLGELYSDLGQTADAMQYMNNALAIARDIGYRYVETLTQIGVGNVYLDQAAWGEAAAVFKQAIETADDTANTQLQQEARLGLAEANLYQGQLVAAREMAEAAQQYNFALSNHRIAALLGVTALLQGDRMAARDAFATALHQADELLTRNPQFYRALDTKGLALCGTALCENTEYIPGAKEAYKAARAINSDAGLVGRVLRRFDVLAKADTAGILAEVRAEAAGEKSQ